MALNYTHYCLDQSNRLYFADENYIGYSDDYLIETKKVKYDAYGDRLYYFGYYNNKLYMIKKYKLYEIDTVTLALTEIKHPTTFFDWYGTSYGIIGDLLYYTTRYNAETSYHALNLDTRQVMNISVATHNLLTHTDSVKAVSFKGINQYASVYDSATRLYTPTIERYELNSKCELEKASVITAPFAVNRITRAFIYDDNHIGVYANGLIRIYNLHTGAVLHEITSTVQSNYVIYGLRSSSNDFVTLIKENSSSIKLYHNTQLLKSHTSFTDFRCQGQVVTYIAYRADSAIQVVKVGIQKQNGMISLNLGERIYASHKQLLLTKENAYGEEKARFNLNERVIARDSDTVPLREKTVEIIHTKDLALKEYVREPQNGELFIKETIGAKEKQTLEMKEHVEKLLPIIEKDLIAGITQMAYFDNTLYVVSNDVLYYTTDYKIFKKYGFPTGTRSYAIAASDNYLYIAHLIEENKQKNTYIYACPKKTEAPITYYNKVFSNLEPTKIMVTPNDHIITVEDSNQDLVLYVENFFSKTFTVSEERGASKGFGSLVGVEYAPNDDPLYPEYVYHMYLVKNGVLSGFEWDENYSSRRIPERQLAYGTLSHVKLLKHHTIGYVANSTLYVKDYIKNKILYSIDGVSSDYGYKEVGADVYITVFAYGNFDLYKNGVRVHRIVAGFSGALKATCNSPQALMAAISDTQETKHKLYGFNLSLLSYTLPLQEEIIENNTMKLKGTVYASHLADLGLTEEIMSGIATLDLEEEIVDYTKAYATLALKEKVLKPNQDLHTINLVERVCFKPGEWGEGVKRLWLNVDVKERPFNSLFVKETVQPKPVPVPTESKANAYYYEDDFSTYGDPLSETNKINVAKSFKLATPSPLYKEIGSSPTWYTSYGYNLTVDLIAEEKKRVLLIPQTTVTPVAIKAYSYQDETGRYDAYTVTRMLSKRKLEPTDLWLEDGAGSSLVLDTTVDAYSKDYYKFILPSAKTSIRMNTQNNLIVDFNSDFTIVTYDTYDKILTLKEYAFAYEQGLTQKENLISDKVYWYNRDHILGGIKHVPENASVTFSSDFNLSKHDDVLFEVDQENIKVSVRLDALDGSEYMRYNNIVCDAYTLKQAGTNKTKQVYGFVIKAPFDFTRFNFSNQNKAFNLIELYDGFNASKMGECYLGLTETVESASASLALGERIWHESDGERRSIYLTERIFPTDPEALDLTLKEQIQGLDGQAAIQAKERVILPDTDTHSDLYYMDYNGALTLDAKPVWSMPHQITRSSYLMVKFERIQTDWEQNIYLKLASTHGLRAFGIVIGFYDEKTDKLSRIQKVGYIDNYINQYEAHVDITRYIHHAVGQANLVTDKIAYIGIHGFFYDEQMRISSMEVVRRRGSITRDIFTKEFVMTSVRDGYTPEILRYRDNNGYDTYYTYNQVIKFVRDYNDRYITSVVAEMSKTVVPEHISIVASQPIGDLILYYEKKTMIKPAKVELIDNKYYHDFDLSGSENVTDWMTMKFSSVEAEVVIYSIEIYHNGFRVHQLLSMQERIFPAPEKTILSLRERVEHQPGITLTLKETADKLCVSARALGTKEYVTSQEHTTAAALLGLKETAKPYTYSRSIWLNELVPSEPQANALALHEYVLAEMSKTLALPEKVVQYKANSDGKVMVEIVKH